MSLQCTLEAASSADAVTFTYAVENTGSAPIELDFRSAQTHDVAVVDDGSEVWRWSDGQMFAQMLSSETLDPDGSVTYEATWDDPRPGDYEAVAELAARGTDCEARATFSV